MPNPPEAFSVEIDCSPLPTSVKRKWEKARQGEEKDSEKVKFALEKKMEQAEKRREEQIMMIRGKAKQHQDVLTRVQEEDTSALELEKLQTRLVEAEVKRLQYLKDIKERAAEPSKRVERVLKWVNLKREERERNLDESLRMAEKARAEKLAETSAAAAKHFLQVMRKAKEVKMREKRIALERHASYEEKQKAAAASREKIASSAIMQDLSSGSSDKEADSSEESNKKSTIPSTPEQNKGLPSSSGKSSPQKKSNSMEKRVVGTKRKSLGLEEAVKNFLRSGILDSAQQSRLLHGEGKSAEGLASMSSSPEHNLAPVPILLHASQHVDDSEARIPFDKFAEIIANGNTILATKRILSDVELVVLNAQSRLQDSKGPQLARYPTRVFLSAFMIVYYPEIVLSGQGIQEARLSDSASEIIHSFESMLHELQNCGFTVQSATAVRFDEAWMRYHDHFQVWRTHDAAGLEADLIKAAVELEMSRISKLAIAADKVRHACDIEALSAGVDHDLQLIEERIITLTGEKGRARLKAALHSARSQANLQQMEDKISDEDIVTKSPVKKAAKTDDFPMEQEGRETAVSVPRSMNPPGSQTDNLSLVWALLYDPDWRLPTDQWEEQWALVLEKLEPEQEDERRILFSKREQGKWQLVQQTLEEAEDTEHKRVKLVSSILCEVSGHLASLSSSRVANDLGGLLSSVDQLTQTLLPKQTSISPVSWMDFVMFTGIIEKMSKIILQLCAPSRDASIREGQRFVSKKIEQFLSSIEASSEGSSASVIIVLALRLIYIQSKILGIDVANAHLRALTLQLSGLSLAVRVAYSRTKLGNEVGLTDEGAMECDQSFSKIKDALPKTTGWLAVASGLMPRFLAEFGKSSDMAEERHAVPVKIPTMRTGVQELKDECTDGDGSTTALEMKAPVDIGSWRCLVRAGLVHLLAGDGVAGVLSLPETLGRDAERLYNLQNDFQRTFVLSICLRITACHVKDQAYLTECKAMIKKRLNAVLLDPGVALNDVALELSHCIKNFTVSNSMDNESLYLAVQSSLKSLLHRNNQEGRHIIEMLSYSILGALVLGTDSEKSHQILESTCSSLGISELEHDLQSLTTRLGQVVAVTEAVCGPWYKVICNEFLDNQIQ